MDVLFPVFANMVNQTRPWEVSFKAGTQLEFLFYENKNIKWPVNNFTFPKGQEILF